MQVDHRAEDIESENLYGSGARSNHGPSEPILVETFLSDYLNNDRCINKSRSWRNEKLAQSEGFTEFRFLWRI